MWDAIMNITSQKSFSDEVMKLFAINDEEQFYHVVQIVLPAESKMWFLENVLFWLLLLTFSWLLSSDWYIHNIYKHNI